MTTSPHIIADRYLAGELSPAESAAFELSLADPTVAEAMADVLRLRKVMVSESELTTRQLQHSPRRMSVGLLAAMTAAAVVVGVAIWPGERNADQAIAGVESPVASEAVVWVDEFELSNDGLSDDGLSDGRPASVDEAELLAATPDVDLMIAAEDGVPGWMLAAVWADADGLDEVAPNEVEAGPMAVDGREVL